MIRQTLNDLRRMNETERREVIYSMSLGEVVAHVAETLKAARERKALAERFGNYRGRLSAMNEFVDATDLTQRSVKRLRRAGEDAHADYLAEVLADALADRG